MLTTNHRVTLHILLLSQFNNSILLPYLILRLSTLSTAVLFVLLLRLLRTTLHLSMPSASSRRSKPVMVTKIALPCHST